MGSISSSSEEVLTLELLTGVKVSTKDEFIWHTLWVLLSKVSLNLSFSALIISSFAWLFSFSVNFWTDNVLLSSKVEFFSCSWEQVVCWSDESICGNRDDELERSVSVVEVFCLWFLLFLLFDKAAHLFLMLISDRDGKNWLIIVQWGPISRYFWYNSMSSSTVQGPFTIPGIK